MLITREFVFVHLPKTGGMFIRQACEPIAVASIEDLEGHAGVEQIPPEHAHLPVFAVIRNPWDWYVSRWKFGQEQGEPEQTFDAFVRDLCGKADTALGRYLHRRDRDYYSALWWRTFGGYPGVTVGRFESLREDFGAFLATVGVELDISGPATNGSGRGHYWDYYSAELRELVAHKARHLIRTYGYSF